MHAVCCVCTPTFQNLVTNYTKPSKQKNIYSSVKRVALRTQIKRKTRIIWQNSVACCCSCCLLRCSLLSALSGIWKFPPTADSETEWSRTTDILHNQWARFILILDLLGSLKNIFILPIFLLYCICHHSVVNIFLKK